VVVGITIKATKKRVVAALGDTEFPHDLRDGVLPPKEAELLAHDLRHLADLVYRQEAEGVLTVESQRETGSDISPAQQG
jgi:hypothetical protein